MASSLEETELSLDIACIADIRRYHTIKAPK